MGSIDKEGGGGVKKYVERRKNSPWGNKLVKYVEEGRVKKMITELQKM